MSVETPIALALVARQDGRYATLEGLGKLDLPGTHVPPGCRLERVLERRLEQLGVYAPKLVLRWSGSAGWAGSIRPVSAFEAVGWSGTPKRDVSWSTREEICAGVRAALYQRLFERVGARHLPKDDAVPIEAQIAKARCPKCSDKLTPRRRLFGVSPRFDCLTCATSWELGGGELARIASP